MKTSTEYYEDKWDYYDLNERKDIFKFAKSYADYCMHESKVEKRMTQRSE